MSNNKLNLWGIIPWATALLLFLIIAILTGRWLAFAIFTVLSILGCISTIFMKKGVGKTVLMAGCITGMVAALITSLLLSLLGTNSISKSGTSSETSALEATCCDKHSNLCGTSREDPDDDNKIKTWYCCEQCTVYRHSGIVINISGDSNEVNLQSLVFFGDVKGSNVVNGKHNNAAGATDSALANAGDGVQNNGDENIIDNVPVDIDDNAGDNNSLSGGKENINNAGDNNNNVINSTTEPNSTIPAPATVATTTTKPAPQPTTTTTKSTTKPEPQPTPETTTTKSTTKPEPQPTPATTTTKSTTKPEPQPTPETTTTKSTTKPEPQPTPATTTTKSTTKPEPQPTPETTTPKATTKPEPQPEPKPVASVTFQRFDRNGTNYGDVSVYIENPSGDEVIDCGGLGTVRKISDNLYRVEVDLEEGASGAFVITVSGGNLETAAQFTYVI